VDATVGTCRRLARGRRRSLDRLAPGRLDHLLRLAMAGDKGTRLLIVTGAAVADVAQLPPPLIRSPPIMTRGRSEGCTGQSVDFGGAKKWCFAAFGNVLGPRGRA
jgi:hypothetical protein